MPWSMGSALTHTKKANTPAKKKQWSSTANAVLAKSGDEGKAVRVANAAVAKTPAKAKAVKMPSVKLPSGKVVSGPAKKLALTGKAKQMARMPNKAAKTRPATMLSDAKPSQPKDTSLPPPVVRKAPAVMSADGLSRMKKPAAVLGGDAE